MVQHKRDKPHAFLGSSPLEAYTNINSQSEIWPFKAKKGDKAYMPYRSTRQGLTINVHV